MYILPKIKRLTALALAIVITFGTASIYNSERLPVSAEKQQVDIQEEYRQKLDELKKQEQDLINKKNQADADVNNQKDVSADLQQQIKTIEEQIETTKEYLNNLENDIADLDKQINENQISIEDMQGQINDGVGDFKTRLRAVYVAGSDTYTQMLMNSDNFYDVLMRMELIKRVAQHDNDNITGLISLKDEFVQTKQTLEVQQGEMSNKSTEYGNTMVELIDEEARLKLLYQQSEDNLKGYQNSLSDYNSQLYKLREQITQISKEAKTATTTTTTTTPAPKTTTTTKAKNSSKKTTTTTSNKNSNKSTSKKTTTQKATTTKATTPKTTTTTTTTTQQIQEPVYQQPQEEQPVDNYQDNNNYVEPQPEPTPEPQPAPEPQPVSQPQPEPEPEPTPEPEPEPEQPVQSSGDLESVINYAKSNVGGSYVWGGSAYRATDCSGLMMLSYAQIGISLPHKASQQASYGTAVSYDNLAPGDLVFFGGSSTSSIYHVGMYIGDDKMVHAANTDSGIIISYLSSFCSSNNITCIRRLV